ncbi:MAG: hypothetical protein FJX67_04240 [Alphaproteobacteria bacterium]|nr:hypothetical protein [Alphaproteobacteria bacterium]
MDLTTLHAEPRAQTLELIGVAEGRGARDNGCRDGPGALRAHGLAERLSAAGVPARWRTIIAGEGDNEVETIGRVCERLAATELVDAVRRVGADRRLATVEIVEYNPPRDVAGRTARLVGELLLAGHDRRYAS